MTCNSCRRSLDCVPRRLEALGKWEWCSSASWQPASSGHLCGAATVVHMKPCVIKLNFGAKSMVLGDENRDCGWYNLGCGAYPVGGGRLQMVHNLDRKWSQEHLQKIKNFTKIEKFVFSPIQEWFYMKIYYIWKPRAAITFWGFFMNSIFTHG